MKLLRLAAVPVLLMAQAAFAQDYKAAMESYLDNDIRAWAEDPALITAIEAANAERAGYDQAKIDSLDAAWQAEVGQPDTPTIAPIMNNAAADFLRSQAEASGGKITEAFVTDNKGLNVAVTSPTSDMWQGDEDKFTKVFPAGSEGKLLSDVEMDESSQVYQGQISVAITDPATKEVIGTLTVGVNAEAL